MRNLFSICAKGLLPAAALSILTTPTLGQNVIRVDDGPFLSGTFGSSLDAIGDWNGDGKIDYIVVDPFAGVMEPGSLNIQIRSGTTGQVLQAFSAFESTVSVNSTEDMNGDGYRDFLTCSPYQDGNEFSQGAIRLHSGLDGTTLFTTFGSSQEVSLGSTGLSVIGDADGDGLDDFVTSEQERFGISTPQAIVYSSATGVPIRYHVSPTYLYYGSTHSAIHGMDQDGEQDYTISQEGMMPNQTGVFMYSTVSGVLLGSFTDSPLYGAPHRVRSFPDFNGDGVTDFLVNWAGYLGSGSEVRAVRIHSGVDQSVLATLPWDEYPGATYLGGDFDGDGTDDVVLVNKVTGTNISPSRIRVICGDTLVELANIFDPRPGARLGAAVAFLGDLDGFPGDDMVAGAPGTPGVSGSPGSGEVRILGYDSGIGDLVCQPSPANSTLYPGVLRAYGSAVAANNSVTLAANSLPPGEFGFALCSQAFAVTANPGGSQGDLCLGGAIGRINVSLSAIDQWGHWEYSPDLQALPTPTGPTAATAGQTWYFQLWHRDQNPTSTSNFTSAVQVDFQ